jgi:hypothetical protein
MDAVGCTARIKRAIGTHIAADAYPLQLLNHMTILQPALFEMSHLYLISGAWVALPRPISLYA